jgi:NitT/TauT family transport system ATP-binding protein/nitrate/nitrite transport system substrate-binding protein
MRARIGVLRLVDSAPVIVAERRGLFRALGLDARISVEPSWANIADKLTYGLLDAAVMLPPLALAAAMGLGRPPARLVVPMGLTLGGNSIVLGAAAMADMEQGATPLALVRRLLGWMRRQPERPRFAVVHDFSTHNLLLRHWLASAGGDPDRDMQTVVVPPAHMVEALADGRIAGFCAGAPWGEMAAQEGVGAVLLGTSAVWPNHPEKCLALAAPWATAQPDAVQALQRALLRAGRLCDAAGEAPEIARLLADPEGLGLPERATRAALPGGDGAETIRFHAGAAWLPRASHATWFLGQMRRWGWVSDFDAGSMARTTYRPDLLAPAAEAEGLRWPEDEPAT